MTSKIKVDQIENTSGSGDVAFTGTGGVRLDTIKSSSGTTGLTVANTGIVTASEEIIQTDYMIDQWRLSTNTNDGVTGTVASNWERVDYVASWSGIGTQMQEASGIFTFPRTGLYQVTFFASLQHAANENLAEVYIEVLTSGSYLGHARTSSGSPFNSGSVENQAHPQNVSMNTLVNVTNTSTVKVKFTTSNFDSGTYIHGNTTYTTSGATFERKGPAQ